MLLNPKDLSYHYANFGYLAEEGACYNGKNIFAAVKSHGYDHMSNDELREFTFKGIKLMDEDGWVIVLEREEDFPATLFTKAAVMPTLGVAVAGMFSSIILCRENSQKGLKLAKMVGKMVGALLRYCLDNNNGRVKFRQEVLLELLVAPFFDFNYLFGVVREETITELEVYVDKLRRKLLKAKQETKSLKAATKEKLLWMAQVVSAYEGRNHAVFVYAPFTQEEAGKLLSERQKCIGTYTLKDFACYQTDGGTIMVPEKGARVTGKVYLLDNQGLLTLEQLRNPEDRCANIEVTMETPLGKMKAATFVTCSKPANAVPVAGWTEK